MFPFFVVAENCKEVFVSPKQRCYSLRLPCEFRESLSRNVQWRFIEQSPEIDDATLTELPRLKNSIRSLSLGKFQLSSEAS